MSNFRRLRDWRRKVRRRAYHDTANVLRYFASHMRGEANVHALDINRRAHIRAAQIVDEAADLLERWQ